MCAVRPIIGNIIAIMISLVGMHYIWNVVQLKGFARYRGYFSITMQIFAAIQVVKSASRSILLPGLCLIFGSAGAHQLITSGHSHLLGADQPFYEGRYPLDTRGRSSVTISTSLINGHRSPALPRRNFRGHQKSKKP